jgi:hypothetical protein
VQVAVATVAAAMAMAVAVMAAAAVTATAAEAVRARGGVVGSRKDHSSSASGDHCSTSGTMRELGAAVARPLARAAATARRRRLAMAAVGGHFRIQV